MEFFLKRESLKQFNEFLARAMTSATNEDLRDPAEAGGGRTRLGAARGEERNGDAPLGLPSPISPSQEAAEKRTLRESEEISYFEILLFQCLPVLGISILDEHRKVLQANPVLGGRSLAIFFVSGAPSLQREPR